MLSFPLFKCIQQQQEKCTSGGHGRRAVICGREAEGLLDLPPNGSPLYSCMEWVCLKRVQVGFEVNTVDGI